MNKLKRRIFTTLLSKRNTNQFKNNILLNTFKKYLLKVGLRFFVDKQFPLNIFLEVSRTCNYSCPMCIRENLEELNGFMKLDIVKKISKEAAQYGATSFSLFLFGESLLNPDIYEICSILKTAHKHNRLILTTNGSQLTSDCSKKLLKIGVDTLFISIPSLDPGEYSKLTGNRGNIDKIYQNLLEHAKNIKKESKTKTVIRIFNHSNEDKIKVPFLKKKGFFIEFRNYHNNAKHTNKYSKMQKNIKRWSCIRPWFILAVTALGEVAACNIDHKFNSGLGSINTKSLADMWKSSELKTFRYLHRNELWNDIEPCSICDAWQYDPGMF